MYFNYRVISLCLLVLLLSRAVVPVGYMVSQVEITDGFSLQLNLCPSQNDFELERVTESVDHNTQLAHHLMVSDPSNDHTSHRSDTFTSQETCHLWIASTTIGSVVSNESLIWNREVTNHLPKQKSVIPNIKVSERKQARAPPHNTLL
jgi:hypothetical protein